MKDCLEFVQKDDSVGRKCRIALLRRCLVTDSVSEINNPNWTVLQGKGFAHGSLNPIALSSAAADLLCRLLEQIQNIRCQGNGMMGRLDQIKAGAVLLQAGNAFGISFNGGRAFHIE